MRGGGKSRRSAGVGRGLVTLMRHIWDGRERGFGLSCVIGNKNVSAASRHRKRIVAGWVCLFAAAFLYAPLAAATWSAHAMACCSGNQCPIAAHHHRQNAPASQHSHVDCEHDVGEMMNCSMSCCESSEKRLVTAVAFVLPHLVSATAPVSFVAASETAHVVALPRPVKPLSPPPRLAHAL
jgi:hypothetical protein